jgi:hypothetical protein
VEFELVGEIGNIEVIATGRGNRVLDRLVRQFGSGNWRKVNGIANIRLATGEIVEAELHWYEAHGIGKRRIKIKRFVLQDHERPT